MQIISAAERLAEKRGHKIVVAGKSGVGKDITGAYFGYEQNFVHGLGSW